MAGAPDTLTLKRHRDMQGREWWILGRRILLALLAAVLIAALLNVFGQRPHSSTAATPRASLKVYAPVRARSGLSYAARFHITAHDDIGCSTIGLGAHVLITRAEYLRTRRDIAR